MEVSRREESRIECVSRVRTETIPASSTLSCPEIEDPMEHFESENAARVFVEDALSLSRKLLTSCGVTVFDEFIFLQMVKNTGAIRAKEYLDRPGLPSESSLAMSNAEQ
jgi:tRNA U34 5-carboxymethylaminomethyl modifying enzyme MnmG/GidA